MSSGNSTFISTPEPIVVLSLPNPRLFLSFWQRIEPVHISTLAALVILVLPLIMFHYHRVLVKALVVQHTLRQHLERKVYKLASKSYLLQEEMVASQVEQAHVWAEIEHLKKTGHDDVLWKLELCELMKRLLTEAGVCKCKLAEDSWAEPELEGDDFGLLVQDKAQSQR